MQIVINGVAREATPEEMAAHQAQQAADQPTLEEAKAAKLAEVLAASDAFMAGLYATYSQHEKLSWPKQEAEAKALALDINAAAPLLRGIATARGLTIETLRDKVLTNVAASEAVSSHILGTQQGYEDQVDAATTVEAVRAISPVYTLPGA